MTYISAPPTMLQPMDAAWDPTLETDDVDEYCWTKLQLASRRGDLETVKDLLAKEPESVNAPARGYYGQTALIAACMQGHEAVVEALLTAGADVHFSDGNNCQRNALQIACGQGHGRIIDMLLAAGAEVNTSTAATTGTYTKQAGIYASTPRSPVTRYNGRTALQAAAERGHLQVVEKLLTLGADVNATASTSAGRTALQAAARNGYTSIVELLLRKGADVNAPAARYSGFTALQAACLNGDTGLVALFLERGADPYAIGGGCGDGLALHAAAQSGVIEIVKMLLDKGVGINVCSPRRGQTALQSAVVAGHDAVEALLRERGAVGKATGGTQLFR